MYFLQELHWTVSTAPSLCTPKRILKDEEKILTDWEWWKRQIIAVIRK